MDKSILRDITYGMYIVSTKDSGCIINTLTQITSDNPIITISLNKNNYTNTKIKENKKFIVSILSEDINPNIISTFGFKTSSDTDKFKDFKYQEIENIKVLEDIIGYIKCEVVDIIDCDTHDIFIAKVTDTMKLNNNTPMTYKYYHEVIKGKAPKNAPTYIEETKEEDTYICDICGYRHKGNIDENFKCPICGVDYTHFKK